MVVSICEVTGRGETERLLEFLKSIGPMNVHELTVLTSRKAERVHASLRILRDEEHALGKRAYILRYDPQEDGTRGRRAPVYAAGNEKDAVEGHMTAKTRDKKYRTRNHALVLTKERLRRGSKVSVWQGLMK